MRIMWHNIMYIGEREVPPAPREPLALAEQSLHNLDRTAFCRNLFHVVPTLTDIHLDIYGVREMEWCKEHYERRTLLIHG